MNGENKPLDDPKARGALGPDMYGCVPLRFCDSYPVWEQFSHLSTPVWEQNGKKPHPVWEQEQP